MAESVRSKRKKESVSYRENSSSSDEGLYHQIVSLKDIHRKTSKWSMEDCDALKINVVDTIDENVFFPNISAIQISGKTSILVLDGINRDLFANLDIKSIMDKIKDTSALTVIADAKDLLTGDANATKDESEVDKFSISLLTFMGFNNYPLTMKPQALRKITLTKFEISSKVDILVTNRDRDEYILVIEDKTLHNVSGANNWGEPQILGEIFVNIHYRTKQPGYKVPIRIWAIRIVGGFFTFYRAEADNDYVTDSFNGIGGKSKLSVLRYPKHEQIKDEIRIPALSFFEPGERIRILICLTYLLGL